MIFYNNDVFERKLFITLGCYSLFLFLAYLFATLSNPGPLLSDNWILGLFPCTEVVISVFV